MEKRLLLLMILLGMFFISFVSAASCDPKIRIKIGIYDKILENDKAYFEKSLFQPMGFGEIIQEGDYLFIESFSFSVNNSCDNLKENVIIGMKSPEDSGFSSIAYIPLENFLEDNGLIKYSFELVDLDLHSSKMYKDNRGEFVNYLSPKKLGVEGKWEIRVLYGEEEMHLTLSNEGYILLRELDVRNRLSITHLETLKQLREDSKRDSWRSLFVVIAIGFATIFFMWKISKKQLENMDKQYDKQTEKEDKREEEKQLDLLRTLLTQLDFLKGNLVSYKKTFSGKGYPLYETWDIDISLYFKGLGHKIQNHEMIDLKENLMIIRDKVLIINNLKVRTEKLEERGDEGLVQYAIKVNRKQIIKIINDDLLPIIKKSKKFIEGKFNL